MSNIWYDSSVPCVHNGGILLYFVNRKEIINKLEFIDSMLSFINEKHATTDIGRLGIERAVHVTIEAILDVGNMMIDGFIMRDPGSYTDIIDILVDEQVIPKHDKQSYVTLINQRDMLVRNYLSVNHEQMLMALIAHKNVLEQFSHHVRKYLNNELGVANAFSNEPEGDVDHE